MKNLVILHEQKARDNMSNIIPTLSNIHGLITEINIFSPQKIRYIMKNV